MAQTHSRARSSQSESPRSQAAPSSDLSIPSEGPEWASGMQDLLGNASVTGMIQRKAQGASDPGADPRSTYGKAVQGPGGAVPYKSEMEASFGVDLSGVSAHTGQSDAMANLGAKAATDGSSMAFASTSPDRETVAHEVTHVVQGQGGVAAKAATSRPGDSAENEADRAAGAFMRGETPQVQSAPTGAIQGGWLGDAASWVGDQVGDALDMRQDEAKLDAQEELKSFMAKTYSKEKHKPSTGYGAFDVSYDPKSGKLGIVVKVFFDFKSGDATNADWTNGGGKAANQYDANAFTWSEDEKKNWASNAITMIETHWGQQYSFHNTREHWDTLPTVNVNVDVQQVDDAADGHFNIEVMKWPEDLVQDNHIHTSDIKDGPISGTLNESNTAGNDTETPDTVNFERDTNTRAKYGEAATKNPQQILFDEGKDSVSANDKTRLKDFAQVMAKPYMPDFKISLVGHASADGDTAANQTLSETRAQNVNTELVTGGVKSKPSVSALGETGAAATPDWRRVDVNLGKFTATQTTLLHEFGHMVGLDDEYPAQDGTGTREVGEKSEHSDISQQPGMANGDVIAYHSDSQMSNGDKVNACHYSTFLEALGEITSTKGQWKTGPASPMGDFNVPSGDTAMA